MLKKLVQKLKTSETLARVHTHTHTHTQVLLTKEENCTNKVECSLLNVLIQKIENNKKRIKIQNRVGKEIRNLIYMYSKLNI